MRYQVAIKTPLVVSKTYLLDTNAKIQFKLDCDQPSGSFKIRGMEWLCDQLPKMETDHLICSSGGNAGYSLAMAAREFNLSTTIIVPEYTKGHVKKRISDLGAKVVVQGKCWDETDAYAKRLVSTSNAHYVSPYDDEMLWQGHASMILECKSEMSRPDAVVVAVGGGGLLCGVMLGLEEVGWLDVPVYACETMGAASFLNAKNHDEVISLDEIRTVAGSLGSKIVAKKALDWHRLVGITSHVCSDQQAVQAALKFYNKFDRVVEPACGAALSILEESNFTNKYKNILVIVCGGIGNTLSELIEFSNLFAKN